uniref:Uncharacterized protein n=1 Tax=Oryza sativa subsp. japonica TaxID=39947 RepID=Q6K6D5_ORYSJ|nr:hypothetical protein [Oryza sativa Japonica Group]
MSFKSSYLVGGVGSDEPRGTWTTIVNGRKGAVGVEDGGRIAVLDDDDGGAAVTQDEGPMHGGRDGALGVRACVDSCRGRVLEEPAGIAGEGRSALVGAMREVVRA